MRCADNQEMAIAHDIMSDRDHRSECSFRKRVAHDKRSQKEMPRRFQRGDQHLMIADVACSGPSNASNGDTAVNSKDHAGERSTPSPSCAAF